MYIKKEKNLLPQSGPSLDGSTYVDDPCGNLKYQHYEASVLTTPSTVQFVEL